MCKCRNAKQRTHLVRDRALPRNTTGMGSAGLAARTSLASPQGGAIRHRRAPRRTAGASRVLGPHRSSPRASRGWIHGWVLSAHTNGDAVS
jgi:hypothetical protein